MNDLCYLYFLSSVRNLGSWRIRNIIDRYDNSEKFFKAVESGYLRAEGIDVQMTSNIAEALGRKAEVEREFEKLRELAEMRKIRMCSLFDDDFPANLRTVSGSPVMFFYKGNLTGLDRYSISIVGTRTPTEYGKHTCEILTEAVSRYGIPVVSGFARGIDTVAHRTAIRSGNVTYAVFGCGVDVIYPSENRKLYEEVIENGAVISEFPPGTKPDRMNFPRRNRIISGLSIGTIVIESSVNGGAVLTGEYALEQNREVFAVPGFIHSRQSEGTNEMIKRGQAKLITCIDDVICELERKLAPLIGGQLTLPERQQTADMTTEERHILETLKREPIHIDLISELSGKPVNECLVHLLSLEFKQLARQLPGKFFTSY